MDKPILLPTQEDPNKLPADGAPPGWGEFRVPHVITFQSLLSNIAKVYRNPDQAWQQSRDYARLMRNDPAIMEPLETRQRLTALLNWHLEAEDKHHPAAQATVDKLTRILRAIPRFVEMRRALMEAIWYGRCAVECRWRWKWDSQGKMLTVDRWKPYNGDKLAFRLDDGQHDPDELGIRITTAFAQSTKLPQERVQATDYGMAYFLTPGERRRFIVHKHMVEDAAWESPIDAGAIHGIGIRSRIYWLWFLRQETCAQLTTYLERVGQGFTIWYYPAGNKMAEELTRQAAEKQTSENIILFPKFEGETPNAYGLERIEPNASGIEVMQNLVHTFYDHQIKRYIVGQTLTSEADATGLGSGVADIQIDTLHQIVSYDARNLEETITTDLVDQAKEWNCPEARDLCVRFVIDTEAPNVKERLDAIDRGYQMGLAIKAEDVRSVIGISKPIEGDEVLQLTPPTPAGAPPIAGRGADDVARLRAALGAPSGADDLSALRDALGPAQPGGDDAATLASAIGKAP
ncbi:MAG: DUF935 family protein [Pirellulales bacterium]